MKSLSPLQVSGNKYDAEDVFDMNVSGSEEDRVSAEEEEPDDIDEDHSVRNDHLGI
jgi:hypothetical protein